MKYRLKKDLPFAKAGEEIRFRIGGYTEIHMSQENRIECSQKTLDMLLANGWIEEIKPKEFTLSIHTNGAYRLTYVDGDDLYGAMHKYPPDKSGETIINLIEKL